MRNAASCCLRRARISRPTATLQCSPTRMSSQARPPSIGSTTPRMPPVSATTFRCPGPRDRRQFGGECLRGDARETGRLRAVGPARDRGMVVGGGARRVQGPGDTPTGDDAWHGRGGPLPIRQRTAEENTPSMRAFVEAAEAIGLAHVSDFNGATQHGVGPYPLNVVDGVRVNTGMAYLTAAVRARPNLAIRGGSEVDHVVIKDKRA